MKLIGKILLPFGILVGVVLVGGAVLCVSLSSSKTIDYTYNADTPTSLENIMADDLSASLETIKNSEYKDNKITVDLTLEQLNNILTETLRSSVNENYLKTDTDYLFSESGFVVKKVAFVQSDTGLTLAATVDAFGIIKSYGEVTLTSSMAEGNKLNLDLNSLKVGNIKLNAGDLKNFLKGANIETTESNGFTIDAENLRLTLDVNELITKNLNQPVLQHLMESLPYDIALGDNKATLTVDTTTLFKGKYTRPEVSDADLDSLIATAAAQAYLSDEATFTVTEAQFNYLIQDDMSDAVTQFASSITLGGKEFAYSIADPYFAIANTQLQGDFCINSVESNIALGVAVTKAQDSDGNIDKITFTVNSAGIGEVAFSDFNGFEITFDSVQATFTKNNPLIKVKDVVFNEGSSDVQVIVTKAISF